ncbi:serine/threonine protein kinase [bacterium]|nr:serine/threonine protein kinase [bacterium]MBP9809102.1 serine/threonine protein kinase [bacterium]
MEKDNQEISKIRIRLVKPVDLVESHILGRYRLVRLIGGGSTSSVFEAHDEQQDERVAVKVLHPHLIDSEYVSARFAREAQNAALIRHPNIVRILDHGVTDTEIPFFVMEFLNATALNDLLASEGGNLPPDRAVNIFLQVCAALCAAHEKNVVHRDLKPQNIMVNTANRDHVKVVDFGIAKTVSPQGDTFLKLTQSGDTLGSLLYMSPEQCLDLDVDARSDIYAMGCLMYEALTGKVPLSGRTAFETMNEQLTKRPESFKTVRPEIEIPEALERIVFKAMEKKPERRFQSAKELITELQSLHLDSAPTDRTYEHKQELIAISPESTDRVPRQDGTLVELTNEIRFLDAPNSRDATVSILKKNINALADGKNLCRLYALVPLTFLVLFIAAGKLISWASFLCVCVIAGLISSFYFFNFSKKHEERYLKSLTENYSTSGLLSKVSRAYLNKPEPASNSGRSSPVLFEIELTLGYDPPHKPLSSAERLLRLAVVPIDQDAEIVWLTKVLEAPLPLPIQIYFDCWTGKPLMCSTSGAFVKVLNSK